MSMAENTVWSLMAGGLLSLALLAGADALLVRRVAALRNMLLISFIGGICVLMSGLIEEYVNGASTRLFMVLKASMSPLAGALGLRLLGLWTGGKRDDRPIYHITVWSCYGLLVATLVLAARAMLVPETEFPALLRVVAGVNAATVTLLLLVSVRAALLGDPLARWMVVASLILVGLVAGLALRALKMPMGLGWWIFTASCALLFVLLVMLLVIARNRANHELARLARLDSGSDPVTGLPTGAKLLGEVEHAFWRTSRLRGRCLVVCVYLDNLYELSDANGRTTDNQILAATAARIRRAAGFRCVVGVYHPRCFVIVLSTERRQDIDQAILTRLRSLVSQPLQVTDRLEQHQQFQPQVGIAALTVLPDRATPQEVIHELELQAMDQARRQPPVEETKSGEDHIETIW